MNINEKARHFIQENYIKMSPRKMRDELERRGYSKSAANSIVRNERVKLGVYNNKELGRWVDYPGKPEDKPGKWRFKRNPKQFVSDRKKDKRLPLRKKVA